MIRKQANLMTQQNILSLTPNVTPRQHDISDAISEVFADAGPRGRRRRGSVTERLVYVHPELMLVGGVLKRAWMAARPTVRQPLVVREDLTHIQFG